MYGLTLNFCFYETKTFTWRVFVVLCRHGRGT
jgi:hypothetical protein